MNGAIFHSSIEFVAIINTNNELDLKIDESSITKKKRIEYVLFFNK